MGHSQVEKAKSHERILRTASKKIREHGLDGLSVAELMKGAGLTHGGFYAHFASREHLVADALDLAFVDSMFSTARVAGTTAGKASLASFVKRYLSRGHRDSLAIACGFGALAGEVRHAGPQVRSVLTSHLVRMFDGLTSAFRHNGGSRGEALSSFSMMVGAMVLARAVNDKALSEEILQSARDSLVSRLEH